MKFVDDFSHVTDEIQIAIDELVSKYYYFNINSDFILTIVVNEQHFIYVVYTVNDKKVAVHL